MKIIKILIIILFVSASMFSQSYPVEKVNGDVKYQSGTNEKWNALKEGDVISENTVISTGESSFVELQQNDIIFKLNELSAVSVKDIKKLSRDELLLALAMEDILNSQKKNGSGNSGNTAVYGSNENSSGDLFIKSNDFGIKRLNGAVQLAKNGMEESAVVAAKETYRKYPDVKSIPSYRIFFSNILADKGLYEEALAEYLAIKELDITKEQRSEVDERSEKIKKMLLSN